MDTMDTMDTMGAAPAWWRVTTYPRPATGAGGDNGIAKIQKRREISVDSYYDRPHYLPPHPYMIYVPWAGAVALV
jgi:hypothetical protein